MAMAAGPLGDGGPLVKNLNSTIGGAIGNLHGSLGSLAGSSGLHGRIGGSVGGEVGNVLSALHLPRGGSASGTVLPGLSGVTGALHPIQGGS